MNDLKPVAVVYVGEGAEGAHGRRLSWLENPMSIHQETNLYAIPSTHRVVSAELLEKAINVIAWTEHPIVSQLRAIIDGNQTEREDI